MDFDFGDVGEDEWQPVFLTVRPGLRPLGGGGGPSGFPPEVPSKASGYLSFGVGCHWGINCNSGSETVSGYKKY